MASFFFFSAVIKAKQVGINSYYLVFEEPGGELSYITPAGGGQQVTVQVSHS